MKPAKTSDVTSKNLKVNHKTNGKVNGTIVGTAEKTSADGSLVKTSLKAGDLQYVVEWADGSMSNESFKELELVK